MRAGIVGIGGWLALLVLIGGGGIVSARGEEKPAATWNNITGNVGGEKWGYAGVTTLAAVPGSDEVIAGVSEAGLWRTSDGGKTWRKLGVKDAVPIENRPYQIVFDPADAAVFWVSGNYKGPGVFKTADGGQTFQPLGNVAHVDGIGVDFTDPKRQTLVIGHHEQDRSIEKSVDGGQTWQKIGDKLPEHINFSTDVLVVDAHTYVVNAAGWKQDGGKQLPFGIHRTSDGGASWQKVSDFGPSGPACVAHDGAIYWQALWAAGLIKSIDQGKTWEKVPGPVTMNPIEIAGGKLVAPVEKQLYISANAGKSWEKFGPELPFKPSGIVYSLKGRAIYAWRSTEAKEDNVIAKWDLP